jgi:hypothetical protein
MRPTASLKCCITWLRFGRPVSGSCKARNWACASVRLIALTSTSLTSSASSPVTASRQSRAEISCQRSPAAVRTATVCVATPPLPSAARNAWYAPASTSLSSSRSARSRTDARDAGLRYSGRPSRPYNEIMTGVCSRASTDRSDSGSSTATVRASHNIAMRASVSR